LWQHGGWIAAVVAIWFLVLLTAATVVALSAKGERANRALLVLQVLLRRKPPSP
jgi:hypothetical protein